MLGFGSGSYKNSSLLNHSKLLLCCFLFAVFTALCPLECFLRLWFTKQRCYFCVI